MSVSLCVAIRSKNQKELRIGDLNEETKYQVQVYAARRYVETGHVKKADYSPLTPFLIKREITAQPLSEQPKLAFPSSPFKFNWHVFLQTGGACPFILAAADTTN